MLFYNLFNGAQVKYFHMPWLNKYNYPLNDIINSEFNNKLWIRKIFKIMTSKFTFIFNQGALFYEMISGAPPFYSKDRNQMFKNILEVDIKY